MKRRRFLQNATVLSAGVLISPGISTKRGRLSVANNNAASGDICSMSAEEMGAMISGRKVSVTEIMKAHIARIKEVNPHVNAVTSVFEEEALKDAEIKDKFLSGKNPTSPFFGIPFSVKLNADLEGSATSEGVGLLKENIAPADSPHVALMRKSGAFPLARTNMPDFGLRYHTESDLYGATINPWNALLTPGGSSGGDAVAVATGMVPIGLGNDYGGSIRWPAQCCGVSGLRPGRGRIPFYTKSMSYGTIAPSLRMMAVQGPLARKIGDLRIALEIMSSSGSTDPCWIPSPPGNNLTKSFRVAAIFNPGGFGVDASVSDGVKKAASILERNGGIIEEIDSSSLNESAQFWIEMISADIRSLHLEAINKNASIQSKTFIEELLSLQNGKSLGDYVNYLARINGIAQSWQDFFQKYDAVIGPVCSRNPFKVGADIQGVASAKSLIESQALTVTVNLLGLPSVALPVAVTDNIPQSVQIIGPMFNETRCLDLAQMIENEVGIFTPVYPGKARI